MTSFVILEEFSLNHHFIAKPVCALETPGLCMLVIFSLPWLEFSNIVCDHADCLGYVKNSGYYLPSPPIFAAPPAPKTKNLKKQLSENHWLKKVALRNWSWCLRVNGFPISFLMRWFMALMFTTFTARLKLINCLNTFLLFSS